MTGMAENNSGTPNSNQNYVPKQSGLTWSQPNSVTKPSQIGSTATPKPIPLLKPATPTVEVKNGSRKSFMLFASGVVVGAFLAWIWFSVMGNDSVVDTNANPAAVGGTGVTSGTTTGNPNALPGSSIGNEALVVPSTQDAGRSVMVTSAMVTSPTWVVIYDSNNGVRGNALGAALFFPEGGAKSIKLLRPTLSGKTYLVGRRIDNGDKQFSMTIDQPIINAAGNPMYVEFRTR